MTAPVDRLDIVLLGPPGAGKGTHAVWASQTYGIPHISTGDLLRSQVVALTALGQKAKAFIDRGELVPDALVISMARERLELADAGRGFLLDGFPRNLEQAIALQSMLSDLGRKIVLVFYYNTPSEVIIRRVTGRRIAPSSGRVYNIFNPEFTSKVEGRCDITGEPLVQRPDDNEETIVKRLDVYQKQTASLIEHYRSQALLFEIKGDDPVVSVRQAMSAAILDRCGHAVGKS